MGTRSLTYVYDNEGQTPIVCMYAQYDGYPEGLGAELAEFLNSFEAVTNGIRFAEKRKTANGMGCLAAQLIAQFKTEVGNVYLYPPVLNQDSWQEYEYHIYPLDRVVVKNPEEVFFDGTWKDFELFCKGEYVAPKQLTAEA